MYIKDGERKTLAAVHRLAHEAWVGPVVDGKVVMHLCDNPGCVNPDHLALGSQSKNLKDARRKGRNRGRSPIAPPTTPEHEGDAG
jgi:hypothetical protein